MTTQQVIKTVQSLFKQKTILICLLLYFVVLSIHSFVAFSRLTFLQDAARDVVIAQELIQDSHWVVHYGPKASVGNFYLPPFYYQVHVIVSALFPNQPLVMMMVILLVESATPVLLYLFLKHLISRNASLVIASSYAYFALVLTFSTQAWNPNMIPFFTILTVYAWYMVYLTKVSKWIVIGILSPSIAFCLHFQSVVLVPFVVGGIVYVWLRQKENRKALFISLLLAFLLVSPYFFAEIQNDWTNSKAIYDFFTTEHTRYYDRVSKPAYLVQFLPSFIERVMMGTETHRNWLGNVILWIGTGSLLWIARKKNIARWILLYVLTVILSLRVFKGDKLDHYLLILFPAIPLLLAGLLTTFKHKYQFVISLLLLIIVFQSGHKVGAYHPQDSMKDLRESIDFLSKYQETGSVRLVFHNLNYVNLIYFGLIQYSDLQHDVNSTVIVDVCDIGNLWCVWQAENQSREGKAINSKLFRYLENIHSGNTYQFIEKKDFGTLYTLVIGTTASPSGEFAHPLIENEDRTGTDYLITQF